MSDIYNSLGVRLVDEVAPAERQEATVAEDGGDALVIGDGGAGADMAAGIKAFAARDKYPITARRNDSDARLLPGNECLAGDAQHIMHNAQINEVLEEPALRARYLDGDLLRGLPETMYHREEHTGGGGHRAVTQLDLELGIAAFLAVLGRWVAAFLRGPRRAGFFAPRPGGVDAGVKQIYVAASCAGSVGAGLLPHLGYLIRHVVDELRAQNPLLPPVSVTAIVTLPTMYRRFQERADENAAATLAELGHLLAHPYSFAFHRGPKIHDLRPCYDRIFLFDGVPASPHGADEEELRLFHRRVAMSVYAGMRAGLYREVAADAVNNDRQTRWATQRLAYLRLDPLTALDAAARDATVAGWLAAAARGAADATADSPA